MQKTIESPLNERWQAIRFCGVLSTHWTIRLHVQVRWEKVTVYGFGLFLLFLCLKLKEERVWLLKF